MSASPRMGVLGGMFDPIHVGHLAVARTAQEALALDSVRFIPSARPPHRTDGPHADATHRLEMIRQSIEDIGATILKWEVSDQELRRTGPSYTIDTLRELHAEGLGPLQIFFLTGADAFAEIATWRRYPEVLEATHFVVVSRPGTTLGALRQRLPSLAARMTDASEVDNATTPKIILISADTPDVSSSAIRDRAQRGESLSGLVTPSVAAYITKYLLYRVSSQSGV